MRGLKCAAVLWPPCSRASHPTRVRGLKSFEPVKNHMPGVVAPYAGAWIEITGAATRLRTPAVAPYAGAWIEIAWEANQQHYNSGRTLRGCVD